MYFFFFRRCSIGWLITIMLFLCMVKTKQTNQNSCLLIKVTGDKPIFGGALVFIIGALFIPCEIGQNKSSFRLAWWTLLCKASICGSFPCMFRSSFKWSACQLSYLFANGKVQVFFWGFCAHAMLYPLSPHGNPRLGEMCLFFLGFFYDIFKIRQGNMFTQQSSKGLWRRG